jgi:peptidoglycan/xylan/chitin deacetylase (PgdA/CDA1 family)
VFTRRVSRRRWRSRRFIPDGAILSFHSLTSPALPAAGAAHVSLDAFKCHIHALRAFGELVPLSEFVRRRMQDRDTSGLIAVTLDDAYAALAGEFRDFITREEIPIAVFVVNRAAEHGARFWWDRIDDLHPRVAPDRWRAFEAACGLPDSYRSGQPRMYGPLRPLRQWLLATYAGRWPSHLEPALDALEDEAGYCTVHRSMNTDELTALAALPQVEFGVHTLSHPVLPLLSDVDLAREIAESHASLRERLPRVLPVLAVPFGLYDQRTLDAAHRAGLTRSLTLSGDWHDIEPARHALSRFCVTAGDTWPALALRLSGLRRFVRSCSGGRPPTYPDLPSPTS